MDASNHAGYRMCLPGIQTVHALQLGGVVFSFLFCKVWSILMVEKISIFVSLKLSC